MRRPLWEHVGERALSSGDPSLMRYTADVTWLLDQWGSAGAAVGFERLLEDLGDLGPGRATAYRWLSRARDVFADVAIEDVVVAIASAYDRRAGESLPDDPDWRYVTGLGGIEVDLPVPSRGREARTTGARRAPARRDRRRQRLGT